MGGFVLLTVTVLISGFAVVDASAVDGETTIETAVATSYSDGATGSLHGPGALYVAGNDWLERAIAVTIAATFTERGATVTTVSTLEHPVTDPVLAGDVMEVQAGYVLFSASSSVEARFAYVQSGNATLARAVLGGVFLVISNRDPSVIDGAVTVTDRTTGLKTWPAHHRRVEDLPIEGVLTAIEETPAWTVRINAGERLAVVWTEPGSLSASITPSSDPKRRYRT